MKRNVLKILVPVLVLAMLLQVPFAFSASASALSESTSYEFVVSKADASAAGDIEVKLFTTTDNTELIDTFGACLVLDANSFDFVNKSGEVITDDYKQTSKQVGEAFDHTAVPVDEGESFVSLATCSMVSYNSETEQFYLFISGLSYDGLTVDGKCELANFRLQTKEGVKPADTNMRKMELSEWKGDCPSSAVYPGEISSKETYFVPAAENIVTDVTVTIDWPQNGSVNGLAGISKVDNPSATITVTLFNDDHTYTTTTQGTDGYQFTDVEEGTYTIQISAVGSLGFTINNVVVTADNETVTPAIYLIFGDCNEDGRINGLNIGFYLPRYGLGGAEAPSCDVNGDNSINALDLGMIINGVRFGQSSAQQVIDMSEV